MGTAILRPIIPKSPLYDTAAVRRELQLALDKVGRDMKKTFEATTQTWKTQVDFTVDVQLNGSEASVSVATDNEIYGYVSNGTEPHIIKPVRAKRLRFQSGYRAKTSARGNSTAAWAGGPSGGVVYANLVHHPGTKARHFERRIVIKYQDAMPVIIQMAINRAMKGG